MSNKFIIAIFLLLCILSNSWSVKDWPDLIDKNIGWGLTGLSQSVNPITPGYGVSNYFELTPETVAHNNKRYHFNPKRFSNLNSINIRFKNGVLYLSNLQIPKKSNTAVTVMNLKGKVVFTQNIDISRKSVTSYYFSKTQILSKGLYIIRLSGNDFTCIKYRIKI